MKHGYIVLLSILILIISRLIPHPPNFSPMIVIALLLARECKLSIAVFSMLFSFLISDALLSWWQGYPVFGDWSLFTYSALISITVCSIYVRGFGFISAINGTLFYWWWTNLGVWLTSDIYTHSSNGLMSCFIAALPFLGYSLMGTMVWYFALFSLQPKEILDT
jgi:hypothetical protein